MFCYRSSDFSPRSEFTTLCTDFSMGGSLESEHIQGTPGGLTGLLTDVVTGRRIPTLTSAVSS